MSEDINNPVSKLMTDKLQLVLINTLIWSIFEQGSVVTHLRCDGIFDDQFVTQSLLDTMVEEFWKSVNICRSYGQEPSVQFFLLTGIYGIVHNLLL